jgi:general secretion pathway protein A
LDAASGTAEATAAAENASASEAARARGDEATAPRADLATVRATAHRSEDSAWRELATLWNLVLVDGDPCASAPAAGVACFRTGGGLPALRSLERPGLLRLDGQAGVPAAWVLLTALGADTATVQAVGQRWTLPLDQLAGAWRGEFATLWRTPPGWSGTASAPAVQGWVAGHLAQHRPEGTAAGLPLRDQVRAFQLVQGLPPDGVAGPVTLMRLNLVVGVAEPRLGTGATP